MCFWFDLKNSWNCLTSYAVLTCFSNIITLFIWSFLSLLWYHTYITILVLLHCAAFNLCFLYSAVWHLCSICLHYVLCLSSIPSSTPSICIFLWLLPPSLFRSTEQWACGGWAIWARPAVPPPPFIPPQTPSHRSAGRQRQVNIQRNKGQTC